MIVYIVGTIIIVVCAFWLCVIYYTDTKESKDFERRQNERSDVLREKEEEEIREELNELF